MTSKSLEFRVDQRGLALGLAEVLEEGTEALARLDADALRRLEQRALAVQRDLETRGERVSGTDEGREQLEACRRIFAEVLRATGEHLNLMKRISSQGKELPWVR